MFDGERASLARLAAQRGQHQVLRRSATCIVLSFTNSHVQSAMMAPSGFSKATSSTTRCVSNTKGMVLEAADFGSREGEAWIDVALSSWIGSPRPQDETATTRLRGPHLK